MPRSLIKSTFGIYPLYRMRPVELFTVVDNGQRPMKLLFMILYLAPHSYIYHFKMLVVYETNKILNMFYAWFNNFKVILGYFFLLLGNS